MVKVLNQINDVLDQGEKALKSGIGQMNHVMVQKSGIVMRASRSRRVVVKVSRGSQVVLF